MGSVEMLHSLMIEKRLKIALAESCTGGAIAASLTKIPGASEYFLGSIVAYCNDLKVRLLQVSQATLCHGAVSREVVQEMLQGLFATTAADVGLAVSGIAGPSGGTTDKPVGMVWIAYGQRSGSLVVKQLSLQGERSQIIHEATQMSVSLLCDYVKAMP